MNLKNCFLDIHSAFENCVRLSRIWRDTNNVELNSTKVSTCGANSLLPWVDYFIQNIYMEVGGRHLPFT